MSRPTLTLHIEKEKIKFSACHFTLFDSGRRERLHGHNYAVKAAFRLKSPNPQSLIDFNLLKQSLNDCVSPLDERVLLPKSSPELDIVESATEVTVRLKSDGARYVFPKSDVVLLDVSNVTSEQLATQVANQLVHCLNQRLMESHLSSELIETLTIRIDETQGQGASLCLDLSEHGKETTHV